jgi:hypothetical protein
MQKRGLASACSKYVPSIAGFVHVTHVRCSLEGSVRCHVGTECVGIKKQVSGGHLHQFPLKWAGIQTGQLTGRALPLSNEK